MDKHCVKTFQELNDMQSKITSLFKENSKGKRFVRSKNGNLLVERYNYKSTSDKLKKNLEEVSIEMKCLKKQNQKLQQENQGLQNVIKKCIKIFRDLDFSQINLSSDNKSVIDALERILSEKFDKTPEFDKNVTVKLETMEEIGNVTTSCSISPEDIKKEIDAIKDLKFNTQFFENDIKEEVMNDNEADVELEKLFCRNYNEGMVEKPVLVRETEAFDEKSGVGCFENVIQETVDPLLEVTPKKIFLNSPVFKDFGGRRQDSSPTEDYCINDSRPKLINEKLFMKKDLFISPLKKPDKGNSNVSPKRTLSSPTKRTRKKLRIESPRKSSVSQLRRSNSREAEISTSGVRKLTQTLLNIECFKKKTPGKTNGENVENEKRTERTRGNETKASCDVEEDDVIMESPKKCEQVLEEIKNKKKPSPGSNDIPFTTPTTSGPDLDETYVSSSILNKYHATGKHILEKIYEDQTPKRSNVDRSPDSVPFAYKREAVRSKAERMKLPGHACIECDKYYKNALGEDISPRKLKEILNKCSRHRDRNSPSHDDTPPGYWKPYLTATMNTSPSKNDTIIQ